MKFAITGSTGFIGSALLAWLSKNNYEITRLIRTPSFHDGRFRWIQWNPLTHEIDKSLLENHDVVVHLAGENIAEGRWTEKRKTLIRRSRIEGTSFLSETVASLKNPPKLFLSASAIGYYGNQPIDSLDRLTESSPPGTGFLASVAQEWEKSTEVIQKTGIRVVHMRFGLVLGTEGGALAKILPFFKLGLGGKIGTGRQIMSWITIDEIPRIIYYILKHEELVGPINFTAPTPVSNKEFVSILGRVLKRPTLFPLPAFVARMLMGEMADELLLGGACVLPRKLQESGYKFLHTDLENALRSFL